MGSDGLSHLDAQGRLRMVDVSDKQKTTRTAVAEGRVSMRPETMVLLAAGQLEKGDVIACARLAAIAAAKRTAELIPLCHPIALSWLDVQITASSSDTLAIEATAKARDTTGVEMEALTAVSVAALTIYDMCKAVDQGITIEGVRLREKRGGKSDYLAPIVAVTGGSAGQETEGPEASEERGGRR